MAENPPRSVLVIDDDADIRGVLQEILSRKGYSVTTASGGEEGLRLIDGAAPQLILLDLMMPGMSGWEFLEAYLAREGASVPVVVLSGDTESDRHAQTLGATGFLRKPIDLATLVETVRRYC